MIAHCLDLESGLIIISYYRLQQSNALLPLHAHGAGGHLGGERPIRGQYPGHVICVDQSGVRNEDPWQLGHFTNASLDKSSTDLQINSFYVSLNDEWPSMHGVCTQWIWSIVLRNLRCWPEVSPSLTGVGLFIFNLFRTQGNTLLDNFECHKNRQNC